MGAVMRAVGYGVIGLGFFGEKHAAYRRPASRPTRLIEKQVGPL
jgi:hypothetical protein